MAKQHNSCSGQVSPGKSRHAATAQISLSVLPSALCCRAPQWLWGPGVGRQTPGLSGILWDFSQVLKAAGRTERREALGPPRPLALFATCHNTGKPSAQTQNNSVGKATRRLAGKLRVLPGQHHRVSADLGFRASALKESSTGFQADPIPQQVRAPPPNLQG